MLKIGLGCPGCWIRKNVAEDYEEGTEWEVEKLPGRLKSDEQKTREDVHKTVLPHYSVVDRSPV